MRLAGARFNFSVASPGGLARPSGRPLSFSVSPPRHGLNDDSLRVYDDPLRVSKIALPLMRAPTTKINVAR
jgi:hypothetical protein